MITLSRKPSTYGTVIVVALIVFPVLGHGQAGNPNLEGIYVETLTSLQDPRWRLEDLLCRRCSLEAIEYTTELLADPKNDTRSLEDIQAEVRRYNREYIASLVSATIREAAAGFDEVDDPVNQCVPAGLFRAAGPLPVEIVQHDDRVILRYEYFDTTRVVHLDGRDHPADLQPGRLGHSIGWYDGTSLVVEIVGIEPHILGGLGVDGMRTSERAIGIERYTPTDDGNRLEVDITIVDPVMLRRPMTTREARLSDPDIVFQTADPCEANSGER